MQLLSVSGWLDRFLAAYYARRPVNATFIGIHDYDHLLPDLSDGGVQDTVTEMERLLTESATLAPPSTAIEATDLRLAQGFLRTQLWEFGSHHFHRGNPSLYTGEAIFGVMAFLLSSEPPSPDGLAAATARLEGIPSFLAQARANIRTAPLGWTQRARRECRGADVFLSEGIDALSADHIHAPPTFTRAAARARHAFAEYDSYLERELATHPNDRYSAGTEALALYLREAHFIETSAEEIARSAEAELAKADQALLATQRTADDRDPGGASYQDLWREVRALSDHHELLTWPEFPIRYRHRPAWAEQAAPYLYFLYYRSPAAFNRPAVHDYLIPPIDPGRSAVKLNHVVHHGGIGHHVQNWHAFRASSRIGQIAAVDCASRIAMAAGGTMAEGWACYATDLMNEFGYLTPLEQRDELATRRRMCARAVVDARLHTGRWSLDQAADYYHQAAGMDAGGARGEAIKNSMFPGGALMYLMGTNRIHQLRREMSTQWGDGFSLRRFHDSFLSFGSIPVTLIAGLMNQGHHAIE
jgi:hypothetical protein